MPEAFGDLATEFAIAYAAVRIAHIALFLLASRDDPALRRSVLGLGAGTGVAITLLIAGSFLDPGPQAAVWAFALALDLLEPYVFAPEGWRLVPRHFAERYGLIIIIALGESIVAIGVGAGTELTWAIAGAATLGIAAVCAMWWMYFDIVALVSARRLAEAPEGKVQNELARDSYSYIHFLMVAGIILFALGLKKTIGAPEDSLKEGPGVRPARGSRRLPARVGGLPLAPRAHAERPQARARAAPMFALIPLAVEISALAILAILNGLIWTVVVYETRGYGEGRWEVRHADAAPPAG